MVTTNSDSTNLDVTLTKLEYEVHEGMEGAADLLRLAEEVLSELVRQLTPIISYIDYSIGNNESYRGVVVCSGDEGSRCGTLVLTRGGLWGYIDPGMKNPHDGQLAVRGIKISRIISGLTEQLQQAVEKREKHLESLRSRKEKFEQILRIARGEA
ncbi:MAG: hypothetical protein ABIF06_01370 [bacterium]